MIGTIKGDTRSLDYGSHNKELVITLSPTRRTLYLSEHYNQVPVCRVRGNQYLLCTPALALNPKPQPGTPP